MDKELIEIVRKAIAPINCCSMEVNTNKSICQLFGNECDCEQMALAAIEAINSHKDSDNGQ